MPVTAVDPYVVSSDTSLDALVDEVLDLLGAADVDNVATLSAGVDADATTLALDSVANISRCLIEVDHELMLVQSVDPVSATATLFPSGRGYRGTAKAPHASGTIVTIRPAISRSAVIREINNEINELFPSIMAPTVIEGNVSMSGWVEIPAGTSAVLDVMALYDTEWQRVRSWEAQKGASADISATGRAVRVPTVTWGNTVRVTVGNAPTAFTTSTQSWSNTGLPISTKSLVLLGAANRLLPAFDAYRLTLQKVEEQSSPSVGPASMLNRELRARYRERLASEQEAFFSQYPVRIHFTQ